MKTDSNIASVTAALAETYEGLRSGKVNARDASEMTNALGKIIKGRAAQLEYFSLRKDKPDVPFWHEKPGGLTQ